MKVLYSFPHKLGGPQICQIGWQQVKGLAGAGADVLVFPGVRNWVLPPQVRVRPTLARGRFRIPYRLLGRKRALALHDRIVARRIERLADKIDIIHTWPLGALRTLQAAARLGIPTVLERPNAHTAFAYQEVQKECKRLGITMPKGHEHAYDGEVLKREEAEYQLADRLLCPSDFVARTFFERGFQPDKLERHQYGFDNELFYPASKPDQQRTGLTFIFAAVCAPRKGLHYALDAWLMSSAHKSGTFMIAGNFIPGYAERLSSQLKHPSVQVLGHRKDMPNLMQRSDVFVLPSVEEGSALVTYEARGSGCVLLVSDAAGAVCKHSENAFVHAVRDVQTLAKQMTLLHEDRSLLEKLRASSLRTATELTWSATGVKLFQVYKKVIGTKLN